MANSSFKVKKSLNIEPANAPTLNEAGDIGFDSADSKLKVHDGSSTDAVVQESKSQPLTNKTIDADQNTITNIDNADIKAGAAIAYSKLNLANSIVNADVAAGANISYSKLNLAGSIVNADVATGAAIAVDKLAALTASKALQSNASGVIEASTVTSTELGYVSGVTSSIQTQLNSKQASGNYITDLTGDVTATGPGNVAATIANDAVTNAKLANMSTQTIKGRTTAGSGDPEDLTATQATAILNTMVGDSGSGGTKGLVPAPAAGDAAASKFLKADGTWATAGAAITVKDEGTNVDTAVTTINFTGSGVTATQTSPGVVQVAISGGGSGGSGGADENYLLDQLDQDELDIITAEAVNSIRDDFGDSEKGTKTNTVQALSTLALATGQNSGTYERIRETSQVSGAVKGVARMQLQALAPDNNGLSSNVFTFSGDVSGYFSANNTKVLVCKKIQSDGDTVHVFVRSSDTVIARLLVTAVSYNSGTNKTSVTVSNPGALDLDLNLTGSEYAEKLRVIPMTHDIQAKSLAASSYETMDVSEAHGSSTVSIPGQAAFMESINFTGTVIHHDVKFSPNGTYAIARVIERVSGGDQWRFYGSSNKGITWTLLGSKTASTGNFAEEIGMETYRIHQNQIVVADNGKWFSAYQIFNGSTYDMKGVYGDLTLSNFLDSAAQTSNPLGTVGAGNISVTGSDDSRTIVTGDTVDLSNVAVAAHVSGGSFWVITYSNGGATHINSKVFSVDSGNEAGRIIMTGTSGAHRVWWVAQITAPSTPGSYFGYLSESDGYTNFRDASGALGYNAIGNYNLLDIAVHNNKVVLIKELGGSIPTYQYVGNATTGTPTGLSAEYQLSSLALDRYMGTPNNTVANFLKQSYNRIYLNTDRLVYALDYAHADGVRRTHVHEVRDITSYQGNWLSQTTTSSNFNWRHNTSSQKIAQTFQMTSNRFRTFAFRGYQVGTIGTGYTLTAKIYPVSGALPDTSGSALYTAINSYDPRNLTKSTSGQELFFSFDTPALVNGTTYAVVVETTAPINASNYLVFLGAGSNAYANGIFSGFDGTTWSNPGWDLYFRIYGDWIYDLSHETRNESQEYGRQVWNQEATLAAIDSSTLRMAHRRTINNTDALRAQSGHVWTSLISLGSGSAASTYTAPSQIGYQSNAYDKNIVLSVIPDDSRFTSVDRTTGSVSTTARAEDRSGSSAYINLYANIDASDYTSDGSFYYGKCIDFNGTDERIRYESSNSGNELWRLNSAYPFMLEFEIKPSVIGSSFYPLFGAYNSAASYGWSVGINNGGVSGRLGIEIYNSGGSLIGSAIAANGTIALNTYYCVRITYAGDGSAPKIYLSTTGPTGFSSEVTYASQTSFSSSTSNTASLNFANIFDGSERYGNFKLGYFVFAKGASSDSVTGAVYQPSHVGLINTGSKVFAERKAGSIHYTDMNSSYDEFGMIDPNGSSVAIVDSNDIYLVYDHTIAGTKGQAMYLKVNMARAGSTDVGAIKGINFKFSK